MDPASSGQYKAGRILLLIGAILSAVGAVFLLVAGLFLLAIGDNLLGEGEASFGPMVVGALYLGLGLMTGVGAVFGFVAQARADRGDAHGAWVFGLVAGLVPPVQILPLIGAILVLTSPEHGRRAGATS